MFLHLQLRVAASLLPGIAGNVAAAGNTTTNESESSYTLSGLSIPDKETGSNGLGGLDDGSPPGFPRPFVPSAFLDSSQLFDDAMDQIAGMVMFAHAPLNVWNVTPTLFLKGSEGRWALEGGM